MEKAELNNEVNNEDLKAALRSIERDRLTSEVKSWDASVEIKTKTSSRISILKPLLKYGIAAAIISLIAITQFLPSRGNNIKDISASYVDAFPNVTYPITRSTDHTELLDYMGAYENGQYKEAADGLASFCDQQEYEATCFYLAMCQMQTGEWLAAIDNLNKVKARSIPDLMTKVDWYTALCLINIDDQSGARNYLEDIVKDQSYNHALAEDLLDEMR